MDWFAKDLVLDSFHEAFTGVFGENYEQLYIKQRLQQSNLHLRNYADNFVQKIMQEALEIVKGQIDDKEEKV